MSALLTPGGPVTLVVDGEADTLVVLAHGAGAGMDARHMLRLTNLLQACGASVARFNFLYKEQGKGIPDKMPLLMETYAAVAYHLRADYSPKKLICAGHSMGGRTASMLAADQFPMNGLLLFSYPLHPAGKPEKLRDAHLPAISVPTLCFDGTQDELCQRELMEAVLPRLQKSWTMHWVEGADHSLEVKRSTGRSNADVNGELKAAITLWLASI
jgi:predicted alpha/beta-hydrolase family hydrolase